MTDRVTVTMPRLGESVAGGVLIKWLVRPGAKVKAFDTIAEVETDKVSAEIPTPVTGIVRELLASEGDAVKVGAAIAVIEGLPTAQIAVVSPAPAPASASGGQTPPTQAPTDRQREGRAKNRHAHSPAVRELARAHNVDLTVVRGSGAGGRVTRTDVMRVIEQGETRPVFKPALAAPIAEPDDGDEIVQLTRIRRLIAENMVLSKTTIPHAWQSQEVDMSGVVANRNANKERFEREEGFSLTFLPYVVAAAAAALRSHPFANATFHADGIVLHKAINIGIAIGLEEGVVVPAVQRADALSIKGLARAINDFGARACVKKLSADELSRATFTVNNTGTFGTVVSYSVISPGQAGILTMGAIKDRVIAVEDRIAIRPMMFLSFSLDHRILDGLGAARFLSTCRHWLESVRADSPVP